MPQLFSFSIQQSLILRDSELSKHIRAITHIVLQCAWLPGESHFSKLRDVMVVMSLPLDGWGAGSEVCTYLTAHMVTVCSLPPSSSSSLVFFPVLLSGTCY